MSTHMQCCLPVLRPVTADAHSLDHGGAVLQMPRWTVPGLASRAAALGASRAAASGASRAAAMRASRAAASGASRAAATQASRAASGASRAAASGASRAAASGASRAVVMKAAWPAQAVALVALEPAQAAMRAARVVTAARVTTAASAVRSRSRPRAPRTRPREHMQVRTSWPSVLVMPGQLHVQQHDMEFCARSKVCRGTFESNILMSTLTGSPAALLRACHSSGSALQRCHPHRHFLPRPVDGFGVCFNGLGLRLLVASAFGFFC